MKLFRNSGTPSLGLLTALALFTAGCGERQPPQGRNREAAQAAPQESIATPEVAPTSDLSPPPLAAPSLSPSPASPPVDLASQPTVVPKLTAEVETSALIVRVSVASTIEHAFPCVLLNHEALGAAAQDSTERMAAGVVQGVREQVLRDSTHCVIKVQRTKILSGQPAAVLLNASLHHFDPGTGVAIFKFNENFPYRLDTGMATSAEGTVAMAMRMEAQYSTAPIRVQLLPAARKGDAVEVTDTATPGSAEPAGPLPLLDAQQRLAGFGVKAASGTWSFHGLTLPDMELRPPSYVPTSLASGSKSDRAVTFRVKGALSGPAPRMHTVVILTKRVEKAEAEAFRPAEKPDADQPPITDEPGKMLTLGHTQSFDLALDVPRGAEPEHHLVQVQLLDERGVKPVFTGVPFLVTLQSQGGGVVPSAKGILLEGTNEEPPTTASAPATAVVKESRAPTDHTLKALTTEADIQYGVPLRGGREVLVKLAQEPHWKRLSLEKGEWLPLPAEDLSSVHLAGNQECLYLLSPSTRELRRYNTETLKLETTVRLPGNDTPLGVAAGNFTSGAPVTVLTSGGILCCDPRTLEATNSPYSKSGMEGKPHSFGLFLASGDGTLVQLRTPPTANVSLPGSEYWAFSSTVFGFRRAESMVTPRGLTVSSSYLWSEGVSYKGPGEIVNRRDLPSPSPRNRLMLHGPVSTSPVFLSIHCGDPSKVPPIPARCTILSYFCQTPLLSFDMPELETPGWGRKESVVESHFWFDPTSLSVACWHSNRSITVRTFDKSKVTPVEPILLNYPETLLPRGKKIVFDPLIAGPPAARAKLPESSKTATLDGSAKIHWEFSESQPVQDASLHFQLAPAVDAPPSADIFVKLRELGPQRVAVLSPGLDPKIFQAAQRPGNSGGLLDALTGLESQVFFFERPIHRVSELDEYLLLHYQDEALGLFSLKEKKVVATMPLGEQMVAFPAGDCLLIYDAATRSLARHELPDLQPAARVPIPNGSKLVCVSVGEAPESPVCLVLENKIDQFPGAPDIQLQGANSRVLRVLEKQTLAAGKWAPFTPQGSAPVPRSSRPAKPSVPAEPNPVPALLRLFAQPLPYQIPCSLDGRVVIFPSGVLIVSQGLTTDHVIAKDQMRFLQFKDHEITASPSGDRVFHDGKLYLIEKVPTLESSGGQAVMSRCGNYIVHPSPQREGRMLRIESTDGLRPLLYLTGVECYERDEDVPRRDARPIAAFGRKNLLVALSKVGHVMQLIDFDLPSLYTKVKPDSTIVTSHPMPVVAEGRTLDYQMTFSNLDTIRAMRVRDKVDGVAITAMGRFTYKAPTPLKEGKHLVAGVELELKTGEVLLHEIPIFIIPTPRPPTGGAPPR